MHLAHSLTGFLRGWLSDRATKHKATLKHQFFIVSLKGIRFVNASSISVGEVYNPPVIASAPALCILTSLLVTFTVLVHLVPCLTFPASDSMYHMSAPYKTFDNATPMYSFLA